jgi:peptidoglycan/LPS O-acetylase OafA/YrhL
MDVIRVVASQLVLFGHAISLYGKYPFLDYPRFPYLQNVAVVLFFLVSGFLISHTLRKAAQRPNHGFASFAVDRVARIYSGYLPALVFVFVVDSVVVRSGRVFEYAQNLGWRTLLGNLLMLQNYPVGPVHSLAGGWITPLGSARPFWTLAIEMWIYLFVGAVVLLRKDGYRFRDMVLIAFLGIVPGYNLFGDNALFSCWLLGALAEYVLFAGLLRRLSVPALCAVSGSTLAVYAAIVWRHRLVYHSLSYVFLFISFTAAFAIALRSRSTTNLPRLQAVVSYLAGFSFSLYLLHYTVLLAFMAFLPSRDASTMWGAMLAANVVSLGLAHFTEREHKRFARWLRARVGLVSEGKPA